MVGATGVFFATNEHECSRIEVAGAFQPERGVAGLLFRGVFLTTEDTEVTEQETAGRWYCFVSAFTDLASARYGREAIAASRPAGARP